MALANTSGLCIHTSYIKGALRKDRLQHGRRRPRLLHQRPRAEYHPVLCEGLWAHAVLQALSVPYIDVLHFPYVYSLVY
jgi:hypothetical protein